jgi:hypothetical protein
MKNIECKSKLKGKLIETIMNHDFENNFEIDLDLSKNKSYQELFEKICFQAKINTRSRLVSFESPLRVQITSQTNNLNMLLMIDKEEIEPLKILYQLSNIYSISNSNMNFFWLDV